MYYAPELHGLVREKCVAYIRNEREFFKEYLTEDLDEYCDRKAQDGVWGDDIEIQAIGEIYDSKIEIYA